MENESKFLAVGDGAAIRLFDVSSGANLADLNGHDQEVYSLAFLCNGTYLVSAAWDGTVRVWDLMTFRETTIARVCEPPSCYFWEYPRVLASPKAGQFAVSIKRADGDNCGCWPGLLQIWETNAGQRLQRITETEGMHLGKACAWAPDGTTIATIGCDEMCLLDGESLRPIVSIGEAEYYQTTDKGFNVNYEFFFLDYSAAHDSFLFASEDGRIIFFQPRTMSRREIVRHMWDSACLTPDGATVAEFDGETVYRSDIAAPGEATTTWPGARAKWVVHSGARVETVAFSADGSLLATGSNCGGVRIWDASTGGELCRPLPERDLRCQIKAMAFQGVPVRSKYL